MLGDLADAMDVHLGLPTAAAARAELAALAPAIAAAPDRPAPARRAAPGRAAGRGDRADRPPGPDHPGPGGAVLATWHHLLDAGRLQDGEPNLAGTARTAVAVMSAATAAEAGSAEGGKVTVATARGAITVPVQIADMPDRVVWLPCQLGRLRGPERARRGPRHPSDGEERGMTAITSAAQPPPLGTTDPTLADFGHDPWWLILLKVVVIFAFLMITTLMTIWAERRIIGRMQSRPGPNRAGKFGLLQSLMDGLKLPLKEDIIPRGVDKLAVRHRAGDRADSRVHQLRDHPVRPG